MTDADSYSISKAAMNMLTVRLCSILRSTSKAVVSMSPGWVATDMGGLNRLDTETGEFRHFLKKDGLADNVVYEILEDERGRLWMSTNNGLSRFDPETETWQSASTSGGSGGCMDGGQGLLWQSGSVLRGVNLETLTVDDQIPVGSSVKGVSIDFSGDVWGVGYSGDAWRADPETHDYDTFSGLVGPYTYSDMTGFALSNAGQAAGRRGG